MKILEILARNWDPKIGDPTVIGWVTVAAYVITAILVCLQAQRAPTLYSNAAAHRKGLRAVAIFMLLLAINKQLDLQTWFTGVGRDFAKQQGWYERRRLVQAVFVGVMALGGLGLSVFCLTLRREGLREHRMALSGLCVLTFFIVLRASSFYHIDDLINHRIGAVRLNWVFELGGICIIAYATTKALFRSFRSPTRNAPY